jgi:hypothetical protein
VARNEAIERPDSAFDHDASVPLTRTIRIPGTCVPGLKMFRSWKMTSGVGRGPGDVGGGVVVCPEVTDFVTLAVSPPAGVPGPVKRTVISEAQAQDRREGRNVALRSPGRALPSPVL